AAGPPRLEPADVGPELPAFFLITLAGSVVEPFDHAGTPIAAVDHAARLVDTGGAGVVPEQAAEDRHDETAAADALPLAFDHAVEATPVAAIRPLDQTAVIDRGVDALVHPRHPHQLVVAVHLIGDLRRQERALVLS